MGVRGIWQALPLTRIIRHAAKELVVQAFQPVQKTLCFFLVFILPLYFSKLVHVLKSS